MKSNSHQLRAKIIDAVVERMAAAICANCRGAIPLEPRGRAVHALTNREGVVGYSPCEAWRLSTYRKR